MDDESDEPFGEPLTMADELTIAKIKHVTNVSIDEVMAATMKPEKRATALVGLIKCALEIIEQSEYVPRMDEIEKRLGIAPGVRL